MAIIKHGNNALSSVTAFPSAVPTGKLKLLSTATASSSSSIEFTSGIDSTYDVYQFELNSIHPQNDNIEFNFNFSTDGGSNYNVTKTTTFFRTYHYENDTGTYFNYLADSDLAQGTGDQRFLREIGNDNDQSGSGTLYLYSPSSSTYVKHFMAVGNVAHSLDITMEYFVAGYCNVTAPVDSIIFRCSSGNIDAGTIKMYGISA